MLAENQHPEYVRLLPYYADCYNLIEKGDSKTVKALKSKYLHRLESMTIPGDLQCMKAYDIYLQNAVWYPIPSDSLSQIFGTMFEKPSKYDLPTNFKPYEKTIMNTGQGLKYLEAVVALEQLTYSRIGLLASTDSEKDLPVISVYNATSIINWHQTIIDGRIAYDSVVFKILTEKYNPETFKYDNEYIYKIHGLRENDNPNIPSIYYRMELNEKDYKDCDTYKKRMLKAEANGSYLEPQYKGKYFNQVPFVAINASDIDQAILDIPVLYEQAEISVHAYNASALYEKKIMQQTWALLFFSGYEPPETAKDPDAALKMDGFRHSEQPNAKAEYVTPNSDSIEALRTNRNDLITQAENKGVVISEKNQVESGVALENRTKNKTSQWRLLAEVRTKGIIKILDLINIWRGVKEESSSEWITPYTEFANTIGTSEDIAKLSEAYLKGTFTLKDIYEYQKKDGYTTFETFEEWQAELETSNFAG